VGGSATTDDLAVLDATAQADLVRSGDVSTGELIEAAIERIERLDPQLNAVIHRRFDAALGTTPQRGPFTGVPFLAKDALCAIAGEPYHVGLRPLRDAGHRAPVDSELYRRFCRAGFVAVGRTNVPELCYSPTTEGLAYGAAHNPWSLDHSPGGSSGGSAAAVAAGFVPVAHGNDAGGSIRIPASACGLVGLKPTRARTSVGPEFGETWMGFNHEHVLTRSVRDSAAVLDAIAGPAIGDPYTAPPPRQPWLQEVGADPGRLRVGVARSSERQPSHPDVAAAVDGAARLLQQLGHDVADAHPGHLDEMPYMTLYPVWAARELDRCSATIGHTVTQDEIEPLTWMVASLGRSITAVDLLAAREATDLWRREVEGWWADHDLLLSPTMAVPPPPLGLLAPGADLATLIANLDGLTVWTIPFNVTGQPAISLPLGVTTDGLPIGVQLVARTGREDVLIRVAAQLEAAAPWAGRRPPVHA
jgi:amidase